MLGFNYNQSLTDHECNPHLGVLQLLMAAVQRLVCSAQLFLKPVLLLLGPLQLLPHSHQLILHDISTGGTDIEAACIL